MYKQIITKIQDGFKNLDKKIIKTLKYGLIFCFLINIISVLLLISYLFFVHTYLVYKIGILLFQISLYYAIFFISSAITVDSIFKV